MHTTSYAFNAAWEAGLTLTGRDSYRKPEYVGTMSQWNLYNRLMHAADAKLQDSKFVSVAPIEPTTCSYTCITEEQCDDCWMIDHCKVCTGCDHYDHTTK